MKHYDLNEQRMDAELKFGAPGLEKVELQEAGMAGDNFFPSGENSENRIPSGKLENFPSWKLLVGGFQKTTTWMIDFYGTSVGKYTLGGGFKCFLFSPRSLRKWSNLTYTYFSNGLKPPSRQANIPSKGEHVLFRKWIIWTNHQFSGRCSLVFRSVKGLWEVWATFLLFGGIGIGVSLSHGHW